MDYQGWGNVMRTISLRKRRAALIAIMASTCLLQSVELSQALTTATSNLTVSISIQATCTVASPTALDFGPQGILSANVDAQRDITVTCSPPPPTTAGLAPG